MSLFRKKDPGSEFDAQFEKSAKRAEKKRARGEYPFDDPARKFAQPKRKDRRRKK